MKQTDVIDKYLEAKATGYLEEQAQLIARSWADCNELHPGAATKNDLNEMKAATKSDLEIMMAKINAKFYIVYALGAAIFAACCSPMLTKFTGH